MKFFKRQLPIILVFIMGIGMMSLYYSPMPAADTILTSTMSWVRIIAAFTLVIGVYSLMRSHYSKIRRRTPGWAYSIVMFVVLGITTISGLWKGTKGELFTWIFDNINVAASATIFSILAFYISSASYRAFRARNIEAALMLVAALIVMVGRIPLGDWISTQLMKMGPSWGWIPTPAETVDWLMTKPAMAARRAIMLGICLSIIATSMRIIFGIERTYMGGKD